MNIHNVITSGLIILNTLLLASLPMYAQRTQGSERAPDWNLSQQMFVGIWIGEGYQCPVGTYHTEKVKIEVRDNFLVATKVTGDNCVPKGSQTFSGKIPNSVSQGSSFPITWIVGNPEKPASSTAEDMLTIIDANKFVIGGTWKTRFTKVSNSN